MHVGDGVVEAVAVLSEGVEGFVVLHPADHMLHPGPYRSSAVRSDVQVEVSAQQKQPGCWLSERQP